MTLTLSAVALLQQTTGTPNPFTGQIFMFGMIILIFWVLVFRPQQKQRKAHEQAVLNLKRGDRIVTNGGIIGDVIHIKETAKEGTPQPSMDDEVTIKSGESRLIVERGRIAKILSTAGQTSAAATETKAGVRS